MPDSNANDTTPATRPDGPDDAGHASPARIVDHDERAALHETLSGDGAEHADTGGRSIGDAALDAIFAEADATTEKADALVDALLRDAEDAPPAEQDEDGASDVEGVSLSLDSILDGVFDSAEIVLEDSADDVDEARAAIHAIDTAAPSETMPTSSSVTTAADDEARDILADVEAMDEMPSAVSSLEHAEHAEHAEHVDHVAHVERAEADSVEAMPADDPHVAGFRSREFASSAQPADHQALAQEDRFLADNVESMLSGDFDSVDQVLDALFDPRIAVLQDTVDGAQMDIDLNDTENALAESMDDELSRGPVQLIEPEPEVPVVAEAAATSTPSAAPAIARVDATGETGLKADTRTVQDGAHELADVPDFTTDAATEPMPAAVADAPPADATDATETSRDADMKDVAAPTVPAVAAGSEAPTPPAPAAVDVPAKKVDTAATTPARPPQPVVTEAAPVSTDQMDDADIAAAVADAGPKPSIEITPRAGATFLEKITPVALPVLQTLSMPMQFVPESQRKAVSFVALTMVFWVPIVWLMVLFMR
ncbi:MAG: hypothetical protein KC983_07255 [Phycisphaerales bacterium]|nr:hypothetical protein [Phycisphaerales bacterium]